MTHNEVVIARGLKGTFIIAPKPQSLVYSVERMLTKIEEETIQRVESQLFTVVKEGNLVPLFSNPEERRERVNYLPTNDKFLLYKFGGGRPLGTVGKVNEAMQPIEFMDNIVETVREYGANLDISTLTFTEFNNGANIEFRIEIEPLRFKNARQRAKTSGKTLKTLREEDLDITKLYLTFTTSYNGTKSNIISLYTERLVCTNGMVANNLEGALKGRNTKGGKLKILSYSEEIAKIVNGTNDFKKKMIELDKIELTPQQIEDLKLKIFGFNNATELEKQKNMKKPTQSKNQQLLETIEESIKTEFYRTGQTAFGLLQGITHYTNHVANVKESGKKQKYSNSEYIRFNQGVRTNNKAQEVLFGLLERKNHKRELVEAN